MQNADVNSFLLTEISLKRLELIVVDIPQKEIFLSAIGKRKTRKALIIKWINKDDIVGYGECSCRPDPFYSHEFVDASLLVLKDYIFPLLKKAKTYKQVLAEIARVRGWNFTKAAIEMAMNDVVRRQSGQGIIESWGKEQLLAVPVGISMGLFSSVQEMETKLAEIDGEDYKRLKFKISNNYDDEAVLSKMGSIEHSNISFDANGSFATDSFKLLQRFASFGHTIEQPFNPGDLYLYEMYLKKYKSFNICLDEDIESYGNLVALRTQMTEANIKPGRVGGLYNALSMIEYCQQNNLNAWIGGMFESGIGRAQNLQIASLLPDAVAHDLSPSSRYFTRDVLKRPITMENGFIDAKYFMDIEVDAEAIDSMTVDKIVLIND